MQAMSHIAGLARKSQNLSNRLSQNIWIRRYVQRFGFLGSARMQSKTIGRKTYIPTKNKILMLPLVQKQVICYFSSKPVVYQSKTRFFINFGEEVAFLDYAYYPDANIMILKKTFVPEALRGQEIAKTLAEVALKFAEIKQCQLKIKCRFVRNYINKYAPEFKQKVIE